MFINHNANPLRRTADDCTIRAISTALNEPWEKVYSDICVEGLKSYDMPSANHVWGGYLKKKGFTRHIIPDSLPQCYTVEEFAKDNPIGTFILALHGHVVACINGDWVDSWNSFDGIVIYYWKKGD